MLTRNLLPLAAREAETGETKAEKRERCGLGDGAAQPVRRIFLRFDALFIGFVRSRLRPRSEAESSARAVLKQTTR